jgi:hypothetical protein
VVGNDEKCTFTVVILVANNGTVLPLQAVYQGHSKLSYLTPSAANYKIASRKIFILSFQIQKHTGQHKQQCVPWLMRLLHHILRERNTSLTNRKHKHQCGKLMHGQFISPLNSEYG